MTRTLRASTLSTLGLGDTIDIFRNGQLPASAAELVEKVFGPESKRGALVISGANGIVGSGKAMQLGSRLMDHGVRVVALDLPDAPDGLSKHHAGLVRAFGQERADAVMANIVRLDYDGASLPRKLDALRPRFLLEAVPEILSLKRSHYELFRERYPDITIRSVTSGFPAAELGVGVAHPAFPHEINKVWETVEPRAAAIGAATANAEAAAGPADEVRLLWAMGLIPMPMNDHWSFVLDVLFCGVTVAALRYQAVSGMPFWQLDKHVRRVVGPNPFRAHDAIGAKGSDYLTWSCLHHLADNYGDLFAPGDELTERKETGENWYPPERPDPASALTLDDAERDSLDTWLLGPLFQMSCLLLHEGRAHPAYMNSIGELCAQFRRGSLALMREAGADSVVRTVEAYQQLYPAATNSAWHPGALATLESPELQQLYVNAEHDGTVGVVTIGREAYNRDVDDELHRALDWLLAENIERIIVSGDFHLSTQLVGADTSEFFPALEHDAEGYRVSSAWSRTARRLHEDFAVSVGFVHGKRCLGGMLELMTHCHFVVCEASAQLGFPEVTLPVVPGMEGCHWPLRKARPEDRERLLTMLLGGRPVRASDAVGWLVDVAEPLEDALTTAWSLATGAATGVVRRTVRAEPLRQLPDGVAALPAADDETTQAARAAISACMRAACEVPLAEALEIQSRHSAAFMLSAACRGGRVGAEAARVLRA